MDLTAEKELPQLPGQYKILTSSSRVEVRTHVLKHGDLFGVFDTRGDIRHEGNGEQGLYNHGTRYLSRMELFIADRQPVLLGSSVRRDNTLLTVNLSNPDLTDLDGRFVDHGTVHLFRAKVLRDGCCFEHLRIRNFGAEPVRLTLAFAFESDYADIFEVRGTPRERHGDHLPVEVGGDVVTLAYRGLDGVNRKTALIFSPEPTAITNQVVEYELVLTPHEQRDLYITIACTEKERGVLPLYGEVLKLRQLEAQALKVDTCRVTTSNEQFNAWLERSFEDLNLLLTEVPDGYYPYAGIPWYSTFFGRDGLLTALMTLWINPRIARGVLGYLAQTQADGFDADRAAEPGKILHEARDGEMAALREIPFGRYYGTVDATPLFVWLAGMYYEYTGDRPFIERIWPNVERALEWIDTYGDVDDDGFVEYRAHEGGLTQQGWKDSEDSIFHSDGRLAEGPIALCEVQGYVYAAKMQAASLARMLGETKRAEVYAQQATRLKERFQKAFWCEELDTYAIALDGKKRICQVRSSNAGHALFTGIAREDHAVRMAESLCSSDMFSGWGIRTLSSKERRYNPMSYHNGSVWPHDNALIGMGFGRYGYKANVHGLLKAFFDASLFDPQQRLPELYCGFTRRKDEGPTPYPVACSPQAWATAVVFCLLQACMGLHVNAPQHRLTLQSPSLPPFLEEVRLENLRVGDASIDLVLQRYAKSVGVDVTRREGEIELVSIS